MDFHIQLQVRRHNYVSKSPSFMFVHRPDIVVGYKWYCELIEGIYHGLFFFLFHACKILSDCIWEFTEYMETCLCYIFYFLFIFVKNNLLVKHNRAMKLCQLIYWLGFGITCCCPCSWFFFLFLFLGNGQVRLWNNKHNIRFVLNFFF